MQQNRFSKFIVSSQIAKFFIDITKSFQGLTENCGRLVMKAETSCNEGFFLNRGIYKLLLVERMRY